MDNFKFIKVGDVSIIESKVVPPLTAFEETGQEDRSLTSIAIEQGSLLICTANTDLYLKAKVKPDDPTDYYYFWKILSLDVFAEKFTDENIGTIHAWPSSAPIPPSYLPCDGSVFDASLFPSLARVLGTNVTPDFRGRYLKGTPPNGVVGTSGNSKTARPQNLSLKATGTTAPDGIHSHTANQVTTSQSVGEQVAISGTTASSGGHWHKAADKKVDVVNVSYGTSFHIAPGVGGAHELLYDFNEVNTSVAGAHTHTFSGNVTIQPHTHTVTPVLQNSTAHTHNIDIALTEANWDDATEPNHVNIIWIIKANTSNSPIKLGGPIADLPTNPAQYQTFLFIESGTGSLINIYYKAGFWFKVSDNTTYIPQ